MRQGKQGACRTRAYIDGYNLYYGCLKHSPYKWLDVHTLVTRVLSDVLYKVDGEPIEYQFQTPAIKYFTAPILKAFAKSDDSIACQALYHTALGKFLGPELEIINGYYSARPARAHKWEEGKVARECEKVDIWKLEEKQSDVALALHALSDALRKEVDQIVVVTNDTDFEPAMKMIRQYTQVIIGLIIPVKSGTSKVNTQLRKHAHWTRKNIHEEEFAFSQLPSMIRHWDNAVHKPLSWYPRPDLLMPIYEEAKRVKGSNGAARKWLNQPCAHLDGRIPIDMCAADETAREVRDYMDRYTRRP